MFIGLRIPTPRTLFLKVLSHRTLSFICFRVTLSQPLNKEVVVMSFLDDKPSTELKGGAGGGGVRGGPHFQSLSPKHSSLRVFRIGSVYINKRQEMLC